MNGRSRPSLAVVVVTFNSAGDVGPLLDAVDDQLAEGDELIVVDNASTDGSADFVAERAPRARVERVAANLGFAGGVNVGVSLATTDLVLLLNPDAVPQPGCLEALVATAADEPTWGCWQAMVALADGEHVNTAGGRVHFLGFGWSGAWGDRVVDHQRRETVGFASGAALCIRRDLWNQLGGFDPHFFMYCEDLELSVRVRSAGWGVGVVPEAVVGHDYEFDKGITKWFYLERNRWATIIATYPGRLLALLFPFLVLFDLALWVVAWRGGWAASKRRATLAVLRDLRHNLRRRRTIQAQRTISSREFAAGLTPTLDGEFFAGLADSRPIAGAQRAFWRAITALL
ncbi:MAG: glycosyltransferase family 2 protein [Solirubrobacteraceae bacterium]|nr:glycosyltransferase family 2 protein [Solirubrobacteraceae bacterium]